MKNQTSRLIFALALVASCAVPERGAVPADESQDSGGGASDTGGGGTADSGAGGDGQALVDSGGGEDGDTPPISFAEEIHEILVVNCMSGGCHGSGAGGYSIIDDVEADYLATLDQVVPGSSSESTLLKKGAGISSHAGGPTLAQDSPEFDLLAAWIDGGANP